MKPAPPPIKPPPPPFRARPPLPPVPPGGTASPRPAPPRGPFRPIQISRPYDPVGRFAPVRRRVAALPLPRDVGTYLLIVVGLVLALMSWAFLSSRHRVTVLVGDSPITLWTRQNTVRGALLEAGLQWNPEDVVKPGLDEPVPDNGKVQIRVAAPVVIAADGATLQKRTQAKTVGQVLEENGIHLKPDDKVLLDGRTVDPETALPRNPSTAGRQALPMLAFLPSQLIVERAVPVTVNDNGAIATIYTTDRTLGSALSHSGVLVYLGDYVSPDLASPVTAGASVFIRRSHPASITVDGYTLMTRTRADNVAGLLAQEGIELEGKDYSKPSTTSPVIDGMNVSVTRVREEFITETESLAFETKWVPDSNMEIDTRSDFQLGSKGVKDRLYKSVFENGKLISRGLVREWIAKAPQNHIIHYGTNIVVRDLTLDDGSVIHYWRKIRLLATSYTASTSGKPRDNPEYGITYLGLNMKRGIVAVDPRVINLRTNVYVPGYGLGFAGDTGGRIKGRRIDLGYEDGEPSGEWYKWVDVYLLAPAPPGSQINWILSDYPSEHPNGP